MKQVLTLYCLLLSCVNYSQENSLYRQYEEIRPEVRLSILDSIQSTTNFNLHKIQYAQIPNQLEYKGTIIEALKWYDKLGENILILSSNGTHNTNDNGNRTELYAYLFTKNSSHKEYKRTWRLYDYIDCIPIDYKVYFIEHQLRITDLNENGIAEISFPYILMCRGDVSNDTLKFMLYENSTKYALRGETMYCQALPTYLDGSIYTPSNNLTDSPIFFDFMSKRWNTFKCIETIAYPYE
ncbi:M949_RS01915 family surface polysaccharide biosynthesis protein [Myroides pelagicus]|uniref:Uncharacterized protein n=1 Tax=Myroides pelagicus TaxID=270914 RepID=A0A7K1GRQ5_9FLAO|nr:hypothetical protein [Myroides pelagicus]MEC4114991.1 hypothetical protein [Myroides pelagicus]MTH30684.1 hypothetical protein [Myroides pelagicus]